MGEGKTEAAFFAHLELQRRLGHRGLYVALPTKATGNAMFEMAMQFLQERPRRQREVARSEVGIVMSLEVSRLSRNDADWYHLVHLCRRVFDKFEEVGTARQVLAWWHAQGLPFPVRRLSVGGRLVVWTEVKYRAILSTLHHPFYAGAYVFGRSETRRELDPDNPHRVVTRRSQRRGLDEWPVLIKDHHPGYITFDKYLANQARIENNEMMKASKDESHRGAAREAPSPGNNLVLTLDLDVQRIVERALRGVRSAAAVVVDIETGRILVLRQEAIRRPRRRGSGVNGRVRWRCWR